MVKLGVNIDHIATLRNARGIDYPDPIRAAKIAEAHGADGITAHLREDRRHIRDEDMRHLRDAVSRPLNMEMANTDEMVDIAIAVKPDMVTLVPERRQELTTEGGLDIVGQFDALAHSIKRLSQAGIAVSLFIDPTTAQIQASHKVGSPIIELHTGKYCEAFHEHGQAPVELAALIESAKLAQSLGLRVNAGHGLNYENIAPILDIPGLEELNIGHSIISEAVFIGLGPAVSNMKALIERKPVEVLAR